MFERIFGRADQLGITKCALFSVCLFALAPQVYAAPPVMSVPGQFGVNASGASTYSVPVSVPPGTAGLAPVLSLDYSSQSGNGIVGLGWMLSGLESIERCPRTYAQDGVHGGVNYDGNDRFCFGGRRLVAISGVYGADGTQYRTEIETFSKIISYGTQGSGPAYFRIWTKSGQIMEFGNTTDSRPLTTNGSSIARSWAIDKVSDAKGNYFTVSYVNDATNGQTYPSRVDYTGNANASLAPYNSVHFVYNTSRSDAVPFYHAGSLTKTTVLLTNVQSYAGTSLVYDYRLAYELGNATRRSRLTSVTLCDHDGSCLKPTTFGWQGSRDTINLTTSLSGVFGLGTHVFGDFNGDGLVDSLLAGSAPTRTTPPYTSQMPLRLANGSGGYTSSTLTVTFTGINNASGGPVPLGSLDMTGSGMTDFYMGQTYNNAYQNPFTHEWMPAYFLWATKNNGNLTATGKSTIFGSYGLACCASRFAGIVGDFNGDGRGEYIGVLGVGDGTFTADPAHPAPSSYGGVIAADFDGNGCSDALVQNASAHSITYYCSPVTATLNLADWTNAKLIPGDFNGDGTTDLLVLPTGSGSGTMYLSTGNGLIDTGFAVPSSWNATTTNDLYGTTTHQTLAGDWNGDGRTDIALIMNSTISIYLSTGTGFVLTATTAIPNSYFDAEVADFNSDGIGDFLINDQAYTFSYSPELLTSVSNGLGVTTTISYDRLNKNGTFYIKCPNNPGSYACGDSYPTQAVDGAVLVVSRVDSSNGIVGSNFSTIYAYAGYKSDLKGRGSLGFAQITATSLQSNIATTTKYRQDYPFIGQVDTQTSVLNGVTLHAVTNSYVNANMGTSSEGVPRYFVGLTQSIDTASDVDASPLPTTTATYHYDCQDSSACYGNMLNSTESISMSGTQSSSKSTTNTYWNDPNNWFIGRLTGNTVTRTKN